ncbi:MAG: hypothetical protein ACI9RP_002698 [Cyclobacteriaceae bacterium]|jgi:hypothetical protein
MSISFETVEIKISKDHSGLARNGWHVGHVAIGRRALLDGLQSPFVFLKARNSNRGCEATLGENCVLSQ